MFIISRITFLTYILFIINFVSLTSSLDKNNEKSKRLPDSKKGESSEEEIRQWFEEVKAKTPENEKEVEIPPDEMEKIKEKDYELANELIKREGKPEISHEEFNKIWDEKKKEYGTHFGMISKKMLVALKDAAEKVDPEDEDPTSEIRQIFDETKAKTPANGEEIPPDEMEKIKQKDYELANELKKKEGKPEISREAFDKLWNEKQKEYGKHFGVISGKMLDALKHAAEKIDPEGNSATEVRRMFDETRAETPVDEEEEVEISPDEMEKVKEEEVEISPDEMEKVKEEEYELVNELFKKDGKPEISHEAFDKVWDEKKKEYGKHFNLIAGKMLVALKEAAEEIEPTTLEASEAPSVTPTQSSDIMKERVPENTYAVRNAKGKICILAKFQSFITITYPGKSAEQKVEVTIPATNHTHTKGKCKGPNGSSSLQILWGKFIFSLLFNKTNEDTWGVTLVELTYDTSENLFDGAAKRETVTLKSKKVSLFETPYEKSYFCAGQEVILLYREDKQMATVHLKEIHIQPDVKDGKFSASHHCNQVLIGDPDEEPYVQDETVPLAVGCTLALITLLILVGFSVHRAYNAAKVDYNTVE